MDQYPRPSPNPVSMRCSRKRSCAAGSLHGPVTGHLGITVHGETGIVLFLITGALGLLIIVPLYALTLRREQDAPYRTLPATGGKTKLSLAAMGRGKFLSLMLFVQVTRGMLFWGITLWLPLAIRSIGFSGTAQAVASAVAFLFAVLLAVPMASVSDRTGKRARVAALRLIITVRITGTTLTIVPLRITCPSRRSFRDTHLPASYRFWARWLVITLESWMLRWSTPTRNSPTLDLNQASMH